MNEGRRTSPLQRLCVGDGKKVVLCYLTLGVFVSLSVAI